MPRTRTIPVTTFTLILIGICVPILTWIASPNPVVNWRDLSLFLLPVLMLALLILFARRIPANRLTPVSALGLAALVAGAIPGWIHPISLALYAVGAFGLNLAQEPKLVRQEPEGSR